MALLPGWHVAAVEDVDLLAPVKFYRDEPRTLEVRVLLRDAGEGEVIGGLRADRPARAPRQGEQETVHFTGRVRLTPEAPAPPAAGEAPGESPDRPVAGHEDVYRDLLPRARLPGARSRLAQQRRGSRQARARPAAGPRALGPADGNGAAADRAVLPDRRRVRARHGRPDGAADASSIASPASPGEAPGPSGPWSGRATAIRGSTPRSSTSPAAYACGSRATARSSFPAPPGRTCSRRCARRCSRPRAGRAMQRPFQRLAIVNRGEPAMRLIHAVRELNEVRSEQIRLIALFTEPERNAMFVRHADEAVRPRVGELHRRRRRRAQESLSRLRRARTRAARQRGRRSMGRVGLRRRAPAVRGAVRAARDRLRRP